VLETTCPIAHTKPTRFLQKPKASKVNGNNDFWVGPTDLYKENPKFSPAHYGQTVGLFSEPSAPLESAHHPL